MNNRIWPGLLLLVLSMLAPVKIVTAQAIPNPRQGSVAIIPPSSDKPSHRELPGEIDMANAEEMMAQRLRELHELHQLQDQVQGMLEDPEFLEQIKSKFTEAELQKLREKLLKGEGLSEDNRWKDLLRQAESQQKLDKQLIEKLSSWTERNKHKLSVADLSNSVQNHNSNSSSSAENAPSPSQTPPMQQAVAEPEPSLFDRMQEGTTKWMIENFDSVGGDIVEAIADMKGNEENAPLAELLRSMHQPDFSSLNVSEQAVGFSRYLSETGDFLHEQHGAWDDVRSFFLKTSVPSLPNLDGASASLPAAPAASGDGWMPTVLSLLLFGLIVLLLCLRSLGSKMQRGDGEGDQWHLGSWPVSPGRVSTRQEVIRAFEYLALFCLGPAAGACHHHELAERLSAQDSGNPARRQAAEMLAWVYEQARYAPVGEALSPEQLSDARQALCLLAGVTAP